jgi:hypothetical protein
MKKLSMTAAAFLAASAGLAGAKTFLVNTHEDEFKLGGNCSLFEAVLSAAQDDNRIDWGCGVRDANPSIVKLSTGNYNMVPSDPVLIGGRALESNRSLEIAGADMNSTRILTEAPEAIVLNSIDRGIVVNIHDLTLDGGFFDDQTGVFITGDDGPQTQTVDLTLKNVGITGFTTGAIENDHGKVLIDHCAIMSNLNGEGPGGGIINIGFTSSGGGNMTIKNSLIYGNSSMGGGGGIANFGKLIMTNSTVSQNGTSSDFRVGGGGGIECGPANDNGTAEISLNHVTVAENFADGPGGGVWIDPSATTIRSTSNSLFALNSSFEGGEQFDGPTGSNKSGNGANLFSNSTGATELKSGTGDLKNVDPVIGELEDFGGKTATYPLLNGSPAIDRANGSVATDQRDYFRPTDGDGNGTATRDIGAYEHDPNSQTETARLIAKSSDTHATFSSSTYSAGRGTRLEANASGDFVTYAIPVRQPGTYAVTVRIEKGTNRGKFQAAYLDDNTGTFVNLGTAKDGYASTSSLSTQTLGNVTYIDEGMKQFRFKVTGKNSASSSYCIYFDYIKLSPL